MITKRHFAIAALTLVLAGCALLLNVRQEDLDAWVGMPVEALDTHSFFITLPLAKTITGTGIEIRNYPNKRNIARCFGSGSINASGYMNGSPRVTVGLFLHSAFTEAGTPRRF